MKDTTLSIRAALLTGLRILYPLCRGNPPPPEKPSFMGMTLNYI